MRQTPSRLTSIVSSTVSGATSRSGPPVAIPALATATSIPPQARREVVDGRGQRLRVAHVGDRGLGARQPAATASRRVAVDVDEPEAHAARRELAGEFGADARRAAGDERDAPVEVPGHRHGTLKVG